MDEDHQAPQRGHVASGASYEYDDDAPAAAPASSRVVPKFDETNRASAHRNEFFSFTKKQASPCLLDPEPKAQSLGYYQQETMDFVQAAKMYEELVKVGHA